MNSCMFTGVIFRLIGLQVGCSGSIVETLFSYDVRRNAMLSCSWSFGLRRGCCVYICLFISRLLKDAVSNTDCIMWNNWASSE
jgi:hypothetical protein